MALRLRSKRNQHLYTLNLFQTEEKNAVDHFIYEPNVHTVLRVSIRCIHLNEFLIGHYIKDDIMQTI